MSDGRIDAVIDRTVREMLDVEPPADLRAKVIARIDTGAEPQGSGFRLWALGFGLAAAALVLVALLERHSELPVQAPAIARAGDMRLPATPDAQSSNSNAQSSNSNAQPPHERATGEAISATPDQARVSRRADATVAAALGPETSTTAIEPLNTINPIEVAPIAPRSITPDPIGVRPLDPITEMQIAPLNPPDRRD